MAPAVRLIAGVRQFREDAKEASEYEQMLKQRPDPLVMKLYASFLFLLLKLSPLPPQKSVTDVPCRRRDGDVRKICISVNPATLLQRAYATLPANPYVSAELRFSWRIVEHTMFSGTPSSLSYPIFPSLLLL